MRDKLLIEWELSLSLSVYHCFLVHMSAEEKSLQVIEFSAKMSDLKSWSAKLLACGNRRGYKKLLVGEGKTIGVDKVPTQTEFEAAEHGSSVQDEAVKKLGN